MENGCLTLRLGWILLPQELNEVYTTFGLSATRAPSRRKVHPPGSVGGGMEETQCSLSKSRPCDEGFEGVTFRWPVEYYEKFRRLGVEIDPWE